MGQRPTKGSRPRIEDEEEFLWSKGTAHNPIIVDSSSDGLTPMKSSLVGKLSLLQQQDTASSAAELASRVIRDS